MNKPSIRQQTLLIAFLPMIVAVILLDIFFIVTRFQAMETELISRGNLLAKQIGATGEFALFSGNLEQLLTTANAALQQKEVLAVWVADSKQHLVVSVGEKQSANEQEFLKNIREIQQVEQAIYIKSLVQAQGLALNEFELNQSGGNNLGTVFIKLSRTGLQQEKWLLLGISALISFILFGLTWLIVKRVVHNIIHPIQTLNRLVGLIAQGELSQRYAPPPVIVELTELVFGINKMASQLEQDRAELEARIALATQALRLKKEEAELANQDKTRFLAAASHDLRQPMHALGLFVGELQGQLSSPKQLQVASKIEESVEALSNLLDALLDISKLDAGVVKPTVSDFSLRQLLLRIEQDFIPLAALKGVTLKVRPNAETVHSDPLLIERILLNLITNAIRYTPSGGRVLLVCRRRGTQLRIEVRDNGIGISPEQQSNIFREFFQVENQERDRSKGLGLGLAIVERIARLLHHEIGLRSAVNCGATFSVTLPLAEPAALEITPMTRVNLADITHPSRPFDNLRVLVIDDDALVRASTKGMIESWGAQVTLAASLFDVKSLSPLNVDLVVCDYRLAGSDGIEIYDYIQIDREYTLPFILISGDHSVALLQLVEQRKIRLLQKPVRPAKLRSLMQFLMKSENSNV